MILGFTLLDVVLVVVLGLLALQGHRRGLWVVLGNLLGLAVGGAVAFFALPVVAGWASTGPWRWVLLLGTVVLMLAAGQYLGAALGEAVRLRLGNPVLRRADRVLGALAAVVVGALLMGLISFSAGATGSTALTREVARSKVLTGIDRVMPRSVLGFAARARSELLGQGTLPEVRVPEPRAAAPSPGAAPAPAPASDGTTPTPGQPGDPAASPEQAQPGQPGRSPSGQSSQQGQQTQPGQQAAPGSYQPGSQASSGRTPSGQTSPGQTQAGPQPQPGQQTQPGGSTSAAAPGSSSGSGPQSGSAAAPHAQAPATAAKPAPATSSSSAPRVNAADAVVRLTGNAAACSQIQSGSGVAVAPDRVITNAHVVAGVDAPTVLDRQRGVHEARVILLDTARDIAVLAVDGANLPVARLGSELTAGASATAMGYPDGGPFATTGARVQSVGEVPLNDIYGGSVSSVDVYVLEAAIRHGYSGGPVVAADGSLTGLVFGRAPGSADVGYALTADAIAATVARASALNATVSSGRCVPGA